MSQSSKTRELTRKQLYRLVWMKPLAAVARDLGMSANGLSKICDRVNVPYPPRGYWGRERAGKAQPRPELGEDTSGNKARISFTPERSPSRRMRSRLAPEQREEQLIGAAKIVLARLGLHRTSMKRVAAEAGISEAQAHNYFTRDALLIELARRELREMEEARQSDITRGVEAMERSRLGTIRYLHEVNRRGALIQVLLMSPAVREALRKERRSNSAAGLERVQNRYARDYGVAPETAKNVGRVLTAVSLRAGRLLANGKTNLETAERLLITIMDAGNQQMVDEAKNAGKAAASDAGPGHRSRK